MYIFKKIFLVIFLLTVFIFPTSIKAIGDGSSINATVTQIIEEKEIEVMESSQLYQKLELELSTSDHKKVIIENGNQPMANIIKYVVNDRVLVNVQTGPEGEEYVIIDFIRKDSLILLSIIFIVLLVFIAKWKGLFSLFGMIFTFAVVFAFVLPRLLAGDNPVLIAVGASLVIIPVSFYLAHGFNKKTTIAVISSIISLIITAVFASIFTQIGHLTGFSSEEAGMLSLDRGNLNMKGILLAGIVIGVLGVLDDITISQAAIVDELANTAKLTKAKDLYNRSMVIGKDHITSMVNTLVLAYAGASLPLLLIFTNNPHPFSEIINYELIAEEIIRTLVGSIGLILAVPITTMIAANWYRKK
ncbi:MAG: YibE/F family protein [Candidatus Shapirobacteria bacterium]|nr:YibE/F family protein [Candidatus Shapirobacteria bacterium]